MDEKIVKTMADDLRAIKDALLGTLDHNRPGLINRVLRLERFYKGMIWFCSVCIITILAGCVKMMLG